MESEPESMGDESMGDIHVGVIFRNML